MNKQIFQIVFIVFLTLFLTACGGKSGNSSTEEINGISVPFDPGENGKITLEGIDSDNDGIRDDVQRMIAQEYGNDKEKYNQVIIQAKTINKLFGDKTNMESEINVFKELARCSTNEELESFGVLEEYYLNTSIRINKYAELLRGQVVQARGNDCE
jgi:ABC-type Fe3+-citrate transport system substrate-binding protein